MQLCLSNLCGFVFAQMELKVRKECVGPYGGPSLKGKEISLFYLKTRELCHRKSEFFGVQYFEVNKMSWHMNSFGKDFELG